MDESVCNLTDIFSDKIQLNEDPVEAEAVITDTKQQQDPVEVEAVITDMKEQQVTQRDPVEAEAVVMDMKERQDPVEVEAVITDTKERQREQVSLREELVYVDEKTAVTAERSDNDKEATPAGKSLRPADIQAMLSYRSLLGVAGEMFCNNYVVKKEVVCYTKEVLGNSKEDSLFVEQNFLERCLHKYYCAVCDMHFMGVKPLVRHLVFKCHKCSSQSYQPDDQQITDSYVSRELEKQFFCLCCNLTIATIEKLRRHVTTRRHDKMKHNILVLPENIKLFKTETESFDNCVVHKSIPHLFCKACGRDFYLLNKHFELRCHHCKSMSERDLDKSWQNCTVDHIYEKFVNDYVCLTCKAKLKEEKHLQKHLVWGRCLPKLIRQAKLNAPVLGSRKRKSRSLSSDVKMKMEMNRRSLSSDVRRKRRPFSSDAMRRMETNKQSLSSDAMRKMEINKRSLSSNSRRKMAINRRSLFSDGMKKRETNRTLSLDARRKMEMNRRSLSSDSMKKIEMNNRSASSDEMKTNRSLSLDAMRRRPLSINSMKKVEVNERSASSDEMKTSTESEGEAVVTKAKTDSDVFADNYVFERQAVHYYCRVCGAVLLKIRDMKKHLEDRKHETSGQGLLEDHFSRMEVAMLYCELCRQFLKNSARVKKHITKPGHVLKLYYKTEEKAARQEKLRQIEAARIEREKQLEVNPAEVEVVRELRADQVGKIRVIHYFCNVCNVTMQSSENADKHVLKEHHLNNIADKEANESECIYEVDTTQYYCLLCKRRLKNRRKVLHHIHTPDHLTRRREWQQNNKKAKIQKEKDFVLKNFAENQIFEKDLPRYLCNMCNVIAVSRSSMDLHVQEDEHRLSLELTSSDPISEIKTTVYFCQLCKEQLGDADNVKKHILSYVHNRNATFKLDDYVKDGICEREVSRFFCEACVVFMSSRGTMKYHMRKNYHLLNADEMEDGVENCISELKLPGYYCELCQDSMATISSVLSHVRSRRHNDKLATKD